MTSKLYFGFYRSSGLELISAALFLQYSPLRLSGSLRLFRTSFGCKSYFDFKLNLSFPILCLSITDQEAMLELPKGFGISVILLLNDFNKKRHFSHGVERNE